MRPRADFACLSKHCLTEAGEATVYELPVDATHCPRGHKRLKRLFNRIAVIGTRPAAQVPDPDMRLTSSSHLVRSNALLQDGFDHAARCKPPDTVKSWSMDEVPDERIRVAAADIRRSMGTPGIGAPMLDLERERAIRDERLDNARLARATGRPGIATLTPGLEMQKALNRAPIPTRAHVDPRE